MDRLILAVSLVLGALFFVSRFKNGADDIAWYRADPESSVLTVFVFSGASKRWVTPMVVSEDDQSIVLGVRYWLEPGQGSSWASGGECELALAAPLGDREVRTRDGRLVDFQAGP